MRQEMICKLIAALIFYPQRTSGQNTGQPAHTLVNITGWKVFICMAF